MIPDAARMRRWMLQGAPLIGLLALGMHAGGGAAGMALWMGLGLIRLPRWHYPYPRKRSKRPGRLFFSLTAGAMLCSIPEKAILLIWPGFFQHGIFYPFLLQMGAVSLALGLSAPLAAANIPDRMGWALGLNCLLLSLLFIFYRQ